MMKPPQKGNQVEVFSETNTGGHVSSVGLSLEEFPHLPGIQGPPPAQVYQSCQRWASLRAPGSSRTKGDLKHGILGPAPPLPLGMPSLEASKQADTCISYTRDFTPRVPAMGMRRMPKEQTCSSINEINAEPFQLDKNDFPPLV